MQVLASAAASCKPRRRKKIAEPARRIEPGHLIAPAQPYISDTVGERWVAARYDSLPYIPAPARSLEQMILARRFMRLGPIGRAMVKAVEGKVAS